MKILQFIAFIFYNYYSKGPRRPVRYLSTVLSMSLILFINVLGLMALFGMDEILPARTQDKLWNYLRGGVIAIPLALLIWYLIPSEKVLKKLKYQTDVVQSGRVRLVIYIIFSMAFTVTMIILKQKHINF